MQKIFNIDKWTTLVEGTSIAYSNNRPRNVRLEVNAPQKSALYVVDQDGEAHFLALVEGRDTIEFGTTGPFDLTVEGANVMIYTADGDDISQKVVAPVIFTKIVERRRRNPELEYIAATMQRNMEKRLEQQAHELEQLFARRAAASESVAPSAGVPNGAGAAPGQADGAEPSDPPVAEAGAGD